MRTLVFLAGCAAVLVTATALAQNFFQSNQSSQSTFVNSDSSSVNSDSDIDSDTDMDMRNFSTVTNQQNSQSSYQQSTISLNSANLSKPHILSVNSSGAQLTGQVIIDGKVVKKLNKSNKVQINLSPYLSVGEHTVEISGRYVPASSSISVELSGPGTTSIQQSNGGMLNSTLNVTVR